MVLKIILAITAILILIPLTYWLEHTIKPKNQIASPYRETYDNLFKLEKIRTLPRFSFDQFLSFYNTNPDGWSLTDKVYNPYTATDYEMLRNYPVRKIKKEAPIVERTGLCINYVNTTTYENHPIFFETYDDFIKYQEWAKEEIKNLQNAEEMAKRKKATIDFINVIQADIDAAKTNCEREFERTVELTSQVKERLNECTRSNP